MLLISAYLLTGCPFKARDVVFVLDNSNGVGSQEFLLFKEFAENISIHLKVGSPNSSVGVILFERFAHIAFNLKEHSSLDTLLPAINPGLSYRGRFNANISDALRILSSSQNNMNGSSAENNTIGLRADTTNIAIVLTSTVPDRYRHFNASFNGSTPYNYQQAANIYDVFAIGIKRAYRSKLRMLASDPSLVFNAGYYFNMFALQRSQQFVLDKLCNSKLYFNIII